MSRKRVCISTLDPESTGGVRSMATAVYEAAELMGHDPVLLCNSLDRDQEVRLRDFPRGDWSREAEHLRINGMDVIKLPRYLPEFEFLNYVLNGSWWEPYLKDADLFVGVGGNNHCCYPFSKANYDFSSWTATLYWEDRKARAVEQSVLRRFREYASYPILSRQEAALYQEAQTPCVLSEYTADRIAERYGISRSSLTIIPYPIDTTLFSPDGPATDPSNGSPTFLFVGRFTDPRKNVTRLLKSFAAVISDLPEASLHLVGDQPNTDIRKTVNRLSIDGNVHFTDYVTNEELPSYYRGADAFVIPSHQEGLCIAGLEAMACGLPVISTRCGGPEEYVKHGENGYLIGRNSGPSLYKAMVQIGQSRDRRVTFGTNARATIEQRYSEQRVIQRIMTEILGD